MRTFEAEADVTAAADLLRALSSEHRLSIVDQLASGPLCVHELVEALGVSQSLVSQHLRVLRGAHVVRTERRGRQVAYSLADHHVAHIVADALTHAREPRSTSPMTTSHETHAEDHGHEHGDGCGHVAVAHGDHVDYLHDGHAHRLHDGHWDECTPDGHVSHDDHTNHMHGPDCGHEAVAHDDHVDYLHDGHRHAAHDGHWDEH